MSLQCTVLFGWTMAPEDITDLIYPLYPPIDPANSTWSANRIYGAAEAEPAAPVDLGFPIDSTTPNDN